MSMTPQPEGLEAENARLRQHVDFLSGVVAELREEVEARRIPDGITVDDWAPTWIRFQIVEEQDSEVQAIDLCSRILDGLSSDDPGSAATVIEYLYSRYSA